MTIRPIEHIKHWTMDNLLVPKAYIITKPAMLQGVETDNGYIVHKVAVSA